ncbi:MAG: tetratricopeptide repeat protein [Acidobacteriota bacterium]|nr:tetratricopeptide repeat protein [Acidobacteriota bacterium]
MASKWMSRGSKLALASALFLALHAAGLHAAADSDLGAGRRAYEASDYGNAVRILQEAAEKNPRDAEIHLLLAKSHFELRQYDAAANRAEKAISIAPDNSVYHEWLGRSLGEKASHASWLSALSLAKKAQREFEISIKLDSHNFSAYQALIEYDCAAPGIAGGGEEKARPKIAELAAMDAGEGHYAAGNCHRQKKDYPAADAEFDKALVTAKSPNLIYDIGDYAAKRGQADRLLAVTGAGQKSAPRDVREKFYRAAALILQKEKPEQAENLLQEYLKTAPVRTSYPHPAAVHEWLGKLAENKNDRVTARREYETSLKFDPQYKPVQEALKRLGKS